jgi:hypothetical protein
MGSLSPPLTVYRTDDYVLDRREKSGSNVRFLGYYRGSLFPYTAMGDGVRYLFNEDFYGISPARSVRLMRDIRKLPLEGQVRILKYLGCHYYIGDIPFTPGSGARHLTVEGFPVVIESITDKPAAPFIVHAARRADTPEERLEIFLGGSFDPSKEVVAEKAILPAGEAGAATGGAAKASEVLVRRELQGRGWYTANLPRLGIAVFPGRYSRGWRAWVDGRKAEVYEVNLFSKGVVVPSGSHEVVLRYIPGSFIWGLAISLAAALLILAGSIVGRLRLRRRVRPASF